MEQSFAEMDEVPFTPEVRAACPPYVDPLDDDATDDDVIVVSRRAISRVALIATETASRFEREAIEHDPMTWLLAPRRLFDGRPAIEACLDREACLRGVLLHGLSLGLDADPDAIDALLADDNDAGEDEFINFLGSSQRGQRSRPARATKPRLFTAVIAVTSDGVMLQAFHASFARSSNEVRERLARRFSPEVAACADVRLGFHPASPLVVALVPVAVADLIRQVEDGSASMKGYPRTFAIDLQQSVRA